MVILHESLFKELGWDDGYAVPAANGVNQRLQHEVRLELLVGSFMQLAIFAPIRSYLDQ